MWAIVISLTYVTFLDNHCYVRKVNIWLTQHLERSNEWNNHSWNLLLEFAQKIVAMIFYKYNLWYPNFNTCIELLCWKPERIHNDSVLLARIWGLILSHNTLGTTITVHNNYNGYKTEIVRGCRGERSKANRPEGGIKCGRNQAWVLAKYIGEFSR